MKNLTPAHVIFTYSFDLKRMELEHFAMEKSMEAEVLSQKVEYYEERIRQLTKNRFGAKSEKADGEQLSFFNEAEAEESQTAKEPKMCQ
ncbi:MAG: transposase, partial [Fibromonadaceae bacterium]|nr:transposase [Fibromonadaceae bacterium]